MLPQPYGIRVPLSYGSQRLLLTGSAASPTTIPGCVVPVKFSNQTSLLQPMESLGPDMEIEGRGCK